MIVWRLAIDQESRQHSSLDWDNTMILVSDNSQRRGGIAKVTGPNMEPSAWARKAMSPMPQFC